LRDIVHQTLTRGNIQASIDCPADLPPVRADSKQLRIVFANLVRNAQEAMAQGGILSIVARATESQVLVNLSDNGIGMSPEAMERIMEPFHSTKARGLGLGLAIVRAILDRHHGRIAVTSQLGVGTTFTVTIPCHL